MERDSPHRSIRQPCHNATPHNAQRIGSGLAVDTGALGLPVAPVTGASLNELFKYSLRAAVATDSELTMNAPALLRARTLISHFSFRHSTFSDPDSALKG